MKALLMAFGYPEYHAACLAPVLWSIVILAVVYITANVAYNIWQRRTVEQPRRAQRQRGGSQDQDQRRCG